MRIVSRLLLLVFCALCPMAVVQASYWARSYGGAGEDVAYAVQAIPDGGYVVAGSTMSFGAGESDAWLLRLDARGDVVWQKTYGGASPDAIDSVRLTADGGFIVAGRTSSFGAGGVDAWVLKLDASGNVVWQAAYGGAGNETASSVVPTADGGYVVAGVTDSYGAGDTDAWVLKLDANGGITWQRTYGGPGSDSANAVQPMPDGGYVIAGGTQSFGAGEGDAWVFKLDASGNIVWQRTYGGPHSDDATSVIPTADGGSVVSGTSYSIDWGVWLLRLDAGGDVIWQYAHVGAGSGGIRNSLQSTRDGGFVVAGYSLDYGKGGADAWLLKVDAGGNVVWQQTYGAAGTDAALSVAATADGGYVLAGYTQSFGSGAGDAWILKVAADGGIYLCAAVGTPAARRIPTSAAAAPGTGVVGVSRATVKASTAVAAVSAASLLQQCQSLQSIAQAAPLAYVGNLQTPFVAVIGTATNAVLVEVDLGRGTTGVAVNASGTRAYAANGEHVFVIDTATNTVVAAIPHGTNPGVLARLAVNPAGTRVYAVANGQLTIIDATRDAVIARLAGADDVAVTPDGRRLYLASVPSRSILVIDAATDLPIAEISIDAIVAKEFTVGLAMDPGGIRLYAADASAYGPGVQGHLTVIDTTTNTIKARLPVGPFEAPPALVVNPAGTRVYVSNGAVVDAATDTVVATMSDAEGRPVVGQGIAIDATGSRVYVPGVSRESPPSCPCEGFVQVIDTTTNRVATTIPVSGLPYAFGAFVGPAVVPARVVEFYHAAFDHYFITWMGGEVGILDAGTEIKGWKRTGYSFNAFTTPKAAASPVCRYYIPAKLGDSHFFGRGTVECNATGQKNPSFVLEDPAFMHMFLPVQGVCPPNTTQVYRAFSNRPDANHRYMTDPAVRDQMVAKGWLAEGDGPDLVVMCAPW